MLILHYRPHWASFWHCHSRQQHHWIRPCHGGLHRQAHKHRIGNLAHSDGVVWHGVLGRWLFRAYYGSCCIIVSSNYRSSLDSLTQKKQNRVQLICPALPTKSILKKSLRCSPWTKKCTVDPTINTKILLLMLPLTTLSQYLMAGLTRTHVAWRWKMKMGDSHATWSECTLWSCKDGRLAYVPLFEK